MIFHISLLEMSDKHITFATEKTTITLKRKDKNMKKIFTLLFCLVGMTMAANATDLTPVYQCAHAVLSHNGNTLMLNNPNMDANHDGVLNIADVTCMINEILKAEQAEQPNCAPANGQDINKLINQVLETEGDPTVKDVTKAINQKLQDE